MDFDIKATRNKLIEWRVAVGADTPEGHACSNLIEQLKAYPTATVEQKLRLRKLIDEQMERLTRGPQ